MRTWRTWLSWPTRWSRPWGRPWNRQSIIRSATWLLGIAIVITMACIEWFGLHQAHIIGYDYGFFYYAFQVVLHHRPGWELYHIPAQAAFLKQLHYPAIPYNEYVYPPQFAVIFSFLGLMPFSMSVVIWIFTSVLLYILGVFWVAKTLWPELRTTVYFALLLLSLVLTAFQNDILVGNVNSILFAAVALTFYLHYRRHSSWLAGIPLGLAVVFKVTPAVIVLYFLLRGKWRVSVSAALIGAVASAISIWKLGFNTLFAYADKFTWFGHESMKHGPAPYNQSLLGVIGVMVKHHWMGWSPSSQNTVFLVYAVLVALLILLTSWRNKKDWQMEMSIASLTPLLFSPLVEQMHFTYAVPALFVLIRRTEIGYNRGQGIRLLGGGALFSALVLSMPVAFMMNYIVIHIHSLFLLQTEMFWGLIVLFAISVWQSIRTSTLP